MMVFACKRDEASPRGCCGPHVRFENYPCSRQVRFRCCDDATDVCPAESLGFMNETVRCSESEWEFSNATTQYI
jgi:hypothetical protein